MADNKNDQNNDAKRAAEASAKDQIVKRPYATLDLKATEIKVTSIADKAGSAQSGAATGTTTSNATHGGGSASSSAKSDPAPKPAPASSYTMGNMGGNMGSANTKDSGAQRPAASASSAASSSSAPSPTTSAAAPNVSTMSTPHSSASASKASGTSATAPTAASTPPGANTTAAAAKDIPPATVIVKKRGGFFSHLAAGLIGGGLVLAGSQYPLSKFGIPGFDANDGGSTAALDQRLAALEKGRSSNDLAQKLQATEARLAAVEKSADQISAIREGQSRLVAETKAALAASASDAGATEQLTRVAALEEKLKALSEAGASDPNAGRLPQLAALTGKVSDLETSLTTQLTSFRKSMSEDVEARIAAVAASSEAAKSGTQRIDRDLAAVKTDGTRLAERLQAIKTDTDKLSENVKMTQEESGTLKAALDSVRGNTAKPADVASAIAPVSQKLASLEQNVQTVVKAEADRRSNAERIVLSLELQNLKRVLDRGQKYDAELAEVRKAAAGKIDLTALDKFKEQGVATLPDLTRDFRSTANSTIEADAEAGDKSVVDRLLAGAKSIVRVRKTSHNADDKTTEAIVGRMEEALKEGRLNDVLEQSKALSPKAREAAAPFLDKVAARNSVDGALAALEGQLKSSLSQPGEPQKSIQ